LKGIETMKKMNKKGFTIVELVIVIAVIAILSAVLIPTFSGVVAQSRETAAIADAKAAYQQYVAELTLEGNEAAEDFIYKYDENTYVVIKDGQVDAAKVYSEADAIKAFGADATYGTTNNPTNTSGAVINNKLFPVVSSTTAKSE
jgi:prepilin-type N-terminal cleavage/methylation domain-containing protein